MILLINSNRNFEIVFLIIFLDWKFQRELFSNHEKEDEGFAEKYLFPRGNFLNRYEKQTLFKFP